MSSLVSVFVSAILPVLSIAATGYLLGRFKQVEVDSLSTVALYVLLPALVIHTLLSGTVAGGAILELAAAMLGFTLLMLLFATGVARAIGETGGRKSALVLGGSFPNTGNFGIPVATFAFGEVGGTVAVVFVLVQNVLLYTVGIYVAARGERSAWRSATERMLRLPVVYALGLSLLLRGVGVAPPEGGTIMSTLELVGEASIPVFLLILGIQLARAEPTAALRRTLPAVSLKLLLAPLVGFGIALLADFASPTVARAFVLLCAGPIAVSPLVLLIEFSDDRDAGLSGAEYLSTAVFVTTVASMIVVTAVIALLRSGIVI